jgi:hypothetical protein
MNAAFSILRSSGAGESSREGAGEKSCTFKVVSEGKVICCRNAESYRDKDGVEDCT